MSATIATTFSTESSYAPSGVALGYTHVPTSVEGVVRAHRLIERREHKSVSGQRSLRVVRRLRGLVLDNQGDSWLVGFEVKGELVEYELPADRLRKHGIKMRHQPFEMDEVESVDPEVEGKLYRFRPLAGPDEAFEEELSLDPERQRLRDLIFAKFGKSQD